MKDHKIEEISISQELLEFLADDEMVFIKKILKNGIKSFVVIIFIIKIIKLK